MGVIVLVYFNKIFSLPAPLLYCVFNRFVLLHKIPNICRFYPYFSMLFRFSICQLFVLLTVRLLNQNTTDAQRKPKKEWVGNHFQVVAWSSYLKITGTREPPYLEVGKSQRLKLCKFENSNKGFGFSTARMSLDF